MNYNKVKAVIASGLRSLTTGFGAIVLHTLSHGSRPNLTGENHHCLMSKGGKRQREAGPEFLVTMSFESCLGVFGVLTCSVTFCLESELHKAEVMVPAV